MSWQDPCDGPRDEQPATDGPLRLIAVFEITAQLRYDVASGIPEGLRDVGGRQVQTQAGPLFAVMVASGAPLVRVLQRSGREGLDKRGHS